MPDREIVLRLNAMGDILLTIPTLRAMAARDVEVHLVINNRWSQLADLLPAHIHFFNGTGSLIKLCRDLKALDARALFDLQGKLATIAIRNLVNAPITRAYQKRSLNEQFQAICHHYPLRFSDQRPVWQKYAETCGVTIDNPDPSLNLSDSYLEECRNLATAAGLHEKKFIFIHPEASKPGKQFTDTLLATLVKNSPLPAAIIGTSRSPLPEAAAGFDLRNRFELRYLPGIIKLAAGIITTDSGPMHIARAVNTPMAAIFLQTCPSLGFAPVPSPDVMVVSRDLPCKPCSLHGQNETCPAGGFACRDIDSEAVATQIFAFLASRL